MPGLPVEYTSELHSELQDYLQASLHLYAVCEQVQSVIEAITVDEVNNLLVGAGLSWRESRLGLNPSAVSYYEWQLASQTGWADAGTLQASVVALDNAWRALRDFFAANEGFLLNTRGITLNGITSPAVADNAPVKDGLLAVIAAILATKGT